MIEILYPPEWWMHAYYGVPPRPPVESAGAFTSDGWGGGGSVASRLTDVERPPPVVESRSNHRAIPD